MLRAMPRFCLNPSAIVLLGSLLGCGGGKAPPPEGTVVEANSLVGTPASGNGAYAQPRSPCDVVDLSPLGSGVGRASSRSTETEGDGRPMTGCIIDLQSSDANNRFMLFVSVDSDPEGRFALFEEVWSRDTVVGYIVERAGIGTKAIYAGRLSSDNNRIDSVLGVLDDNLYLEARFSGVGNSAFDGAGIRDGIVGVAGAAMTALAN